MRCVVGYVTILPNLRVPLPLSQGVTVMVPVALLVMPSGWLLSLWTSVLEYE